MLVANTLYFLVLTNFLRSTLKVGIVTALNIMILLLVTVSMFAQPIVQQSPVPAPLAALKLIPELVTKKARSGAFKLLIASLLLTTAASGAFATVLVAFPGLVVPFIGGKEVLSSYVRLSGLDIVMLSLGQVSIGALIALGEMKRATVYLILWSVVRYALASVLLLSYAITGVLVGWILGDLVLLALALKSVWALRVGGGSPDFSLANLIRYSLHTLLSALIGFLVNQADKIFTLLRQGLPELAVYNVAIVAASFAGFAPYALLTVLLPALSALHAAKKTRDMHGMIREYTRYISIVVLPIAFGFAAITQVALRIFGEAYLVAFVPSVIVSVATGLTAVAAVYASALLAMGQLRWFTAANIAGLGGLLLVSYLLTPALGLVGPALGRAALMALVPLVYALALFRKQFLEFDLRAFLCAASASTIMGLVVFFALTFPQTFLLKLAALPALVVVGALIYVSCLRILRLLTVNDLKFLSALIPVRLRVLLPIVAKLTGVPWKTKLSKN